MSVSILYYKVPLERISSDQQTGQIAGWSTDLLEGLLGGLLGDLLEELPADKRLKISLLHQAKDQLLSLAGLQLLKIAMAEFPATPFSLSQLQFPEKTKPFFSDDVDFNISHSGDIACCIVSDSHQVGIDIELQRDVKTETINKYLDESATSGKHSSQHDRRQLFFNSWTRYEAIIKAANHGSIFNMKDIQLEADGARYQKQFWYTYPVDIINDDAGQKYTCHFASSDKLTASDIKVRQIHEL